MKLNESPVNHLTSTDGKVLSGLFAEMNTFNQNGRRYPDDIYMQAYEELLPKIDERRLLGELDHPLDYDEVRLSNVSHAITECHIEEEDGTKKVYGTVELLDTPAGLIAQALNKAGIPLGISSRGIGATKQVRDGVDVTQLKLITYDLVAEPSFANAVLSPEKSAELSDSLHYIESNLPLNESVEDHSIRDMIQSIRESLIIGKTNSDEQDDINKAEIDSLKSLLEDAHATINSDTELLTDSRSKIKELRDRLKESKEAYNSLLSNMQRLQDDYNDLKESTVSSTKYEDVLKENIELKKSLAVEKRGMSYKKVSTLLEGANTDAEIEDRLNSLSSLGSKRETRLLIESASTESTMSSKKLSGLASIISKV